MHDPNNAQEIYIHTHVYSGMEGKNLIMFFSFKGISFMHTRSSSLEDCSRDEHEHEKFIADHLELGYRWTKVNVTIDYA